MKITNFILKLTALTLSITAAICLILAHLEEISLCLTRIHNAIQSKKQFLCDRFSILNDTKEDYKTWDI